MFNGISQQPASLRHTSQGELQENAYSSIATGLRKRAPTIDIARLTANSYPNAFVHTINRGTGERYTVIIDNGVLLVSDFSGVAKTVNAPDGLGYLACTTARAEFAVVTVADYTFIVNKTVTTAMKASLTGTAIAPQTVTGITQAAGVATMVMAAPHLLAVGDGVFISGATPAAYNGFHTVASVPLGTTITFTVATATATPATGTITYIAAFAGVTGTKQKFSDLAAPTGTNNTWRVMGDPSNSFDDYTVKDSALLGNTWAEVASPGIADIIDPLTMPFKLVREADGTFTFSKTTWDKRLVGDENSDPMPSFIGRKLKDIYFHRNRLGVAADESFVLSKNGGYYNYWIQTVTAIIDTDPVDRNLSHNKVSIINFVVPFTKTLMLFSDSTQFQLTAGDTMTPTNVKADVLTEFESSNLCRPIALGTDLFFAQQRGSYTGVREYFVDLDTISNDAVDITAHCPTYMPKDALGFAGCSNEDVMFSWTLQERNALYVYKYYWGKTEKLQSSWSKYTFPAGDTILNASFIGTTCYLAVQRSAGIFFESMDLQANAVDTGFAFQILLDRRKELTGVYNAGTGLTTWTIPYADTETLQVILGTAFGANKGVRLVTTQPTSTTITAAGDYSAGNSFIGRPYTMRYRFSQLYYRDPKSAAVQAGRLQLARMYLVYDKSGYFRIEVTPKARTTNTYPFTGKVLGDSTLVLGTPQINSGKFLFPIRSNNEGLTIDIVNDSHLPSTFQSAEWEGEFSMFTQRVQ